MDKAISIVVVLYNVLLDFCFCLFHLSKVEKIVCSNVVRCSKKKFDNLTTPQTHASSGI